MENQKTVFILSVLIAIIALYATLIGILSSGGPGLFEYESIRGETVQIYGEGLYKHMSEEVAIQGIAQDIVTLFIGIPTLLISLFFTMKGSLKARFVLAGSIGYFFVSYLFYLVMAMYNELFLAYVFLAGTSFFALSLTILSFNPKKISRHFTHQAPTKFAGGFLIFNSFAIAMLWLGVVLPPLLDGSIYPPEVEHYTTLIVQGLDLAILLPLSFLSGYLLIRKQPFGYLFAPIYLVFLSLLMAALIAKIIYMGIEGYNIIPVIFIIPILDIVAICCSVLLLQNLHIKNSFIQE